MDVEQNIATKRVNDSHAVYAFLYLPDPPLLGVHLYNNISTALANYKHSKMSSADCWRLYILYYADEHTLGTVMR